MPLATSVERAQDGRLVLTFQDPGKPEATVVVVVSSTEWDALLSKVEKAQDPSNRPTFSEMNDLGKLYPDQVFNARPKGLMVDFNPFGTVRPRIALASAGGRLRKFFDAFREEAAKVLGGALRSWTDEEVAEIHEIKVRDPLADDDEAPAQDDTHPELPEPAPTSKRVEDPDGS